MKKAFICESNKQRDCVIKAFSDAGIQATDFCKNIDVCSDDPAIICLPMVAEACYETSDGYFIPDFKEYKAYRLSHNDTTVSLLKSEGYEIIYLTSLLKNRNLMENANG